MALYRNQERCRFPADPNNSRLHSIRRQAVQCDLVDQTPQERFLLLSREQVLLPDLRQPLPNRSKGGLQFCGQCKRNNDNLIGLCCGIFCFFQLSQRGFPSSLELGGDMAIVGTDAVELTLCECRLITQPFDLLPARFASLIETLLMTGHGSRIDVEFDGGERLKESLKDRSIYRKQQ